MSKGEQPPLPGLDERRVTAPEPEKRDTVGCATKSELYALWRRRVVEDDNDFIIAVAPSSQTAISGTGKTTLAIQLARLFDNSEEGFDAERQASLDAAEVANELIPNTPTGTSIIFDEAQGTLDGDGVDSRRGMSSSVIDMARSAAQYRKQQHTLIIVAQSTDWIDGRMMDLIDRLLLIQEKNVREGWARAVSFDHYRNDLPGGWSGERTPAIEDIYWEPLPEDDPDYLHLDKLKDEADGTADTDDQEQINDDRQVAKALKARADGDSWTDIAARDWAEYSREWYRKRAKEL